MYYNDQRSTINEGLPMTTADVKTNGQLGLDVLTGVYHTWIRRAGYVLRPDFDKESPSTL